MRELTKVCVESGFFYTADQTDIDDSADIGEQTKIWSGVWIGSEAKIGKFCVIGAGVHIEPGVILGDYCKVQRGVTLYSGVETEDYVFFGPNATTTNDRNPRSFGKWEKSKTYFEIGSSIGANATVIAGNRIKALALVGAGAVVTKDVGASQLVIGNPARFAGWVDVEGRVISRSTIMPRKINDALKDPRSTIEKFKEVNE